MRRPDRSRSAVLAVVAVAATICLQWAIAIANIRWYAGLLKPTFAPTLGWAGVVSLILAAILARAFFRVLDSPDYLPDRPAAIRAFLFGLGLDVVWSWLFFAGRHPTVALAAAAALAVITAVAAWRFSTVDRRAGLSLLPWTAATAFAFLVDLSIALRNG